VEDPRCATHTSRIQNRTLINNALNAWSQDKSVAEVCRLLQQAQIPCAPVLDVPQVVQDPHIRDHRDMFPGYEQPNAGRVTVTNIPVKVTGTQPVPLTPAPELGQHTQAVLRELLQLDDAALMQLAESGII
jgi:formyl-CoA transferase